MEDCRLVAVRPAALPELWPSVAPFIALGCAQSNGRFLPQDIVKAVAAGDWQLWAAEKDGAVEAMLLTRVLVYPRLKSVEMLSAIGRERRDWTPFIAEIETWARANGCALMEALARPGWERVLAPYGYRKTHVLLEKRL